MEKALAKYPNSVRGNELYAEKLLARGDQRSLDRAVEAVKKLREIAPAYPPTARLSVRLASKRGMQEQVRKDLLAKMPNIKNMKEIDATQKQNIQTLASLFVDLNDLDSAEKLYRDLADRDPASVYDLAEFLGKHRAPEQCFQKLNEIYSVNRIPQILSVALGVARERRDKIGDKFDADIQRWLDAGLRENPGSITLLIVQADLYDLQKRYNDAAKIYRDLLKRNDLKGMQRAVVLNNLAYLMALAGNSTATDVDPLNLIQEAAKILGPNSDILDTRAVIYISRQQYDKAIADLDLSVTDSPTASKCFHLAVAQLEAGNNRAALDAWKQAEALGLGRDALNRMEHDLYEKTKKKIDKLRGTSVTSADSLRKAG